MARITPERDCPVCGSPFTPKPMSRQRWKYQACSDACRVRRERERHQAENFTARHRKAAWYLANRDRILADRAAAQTPEKRATAVARARKWAKENPEWRAANRRAWAKANPQKVAANTQRRLARKRGVPADKVTVMELLVDQDFKCHLCGNAIDPDCRYPDPECPTIDHVIPLSRGGTGLRENLKAAHMRCNSAKGAKVMQA